jgi:transposase
LPLAFHLTGGEASDSRNFEILLDLGPDIAPRAAITDKGYDSKANRAAARKRGVCPVIPYKSNATDRPAFFAKILYKARARIEQAVGKLKRFKRVALRCEKTALNYGSFVALAFGFILVKSVHMTLVQLRGGNSAWNRAIFTVGAGTLKPIGRPNLLKEHSNLLRWVQA